MLASTLALGGWTLAWGGGIYKWVDEQGVTHFGEKPPAPGIGERIHVNAPGPDAGSADAMQKLEADRAKRSQAAKDNVAAETANKQNEAEKARAEAVKKNCEAYRTNLSVLKAHGQIRETAADGQVDMLSDVDKQKRIQEAEKYLSENCKG